MLKTKKINKLLAFSYWLLALLQNHYIEAKGKRLTANGFNS
jgi:hypothetical protein